MGINSLVNREEIRRLQKAARDNNKAKLWEWAKRYEECLKDLYRKEYEEQYRDEISCSIDNFMIAIIYTLHFSEEISLGDDRLKEFLADVYATLDLYRTDNVSPNDFVKDLADNGIIFENYDYHKIYKSRIDQLNNLIEEYEKKNEELDKRLANFNQNEK